MGLREVLIQLRENTKNDFKQIIEKVKQYPLISLLFVITVLLLVVIPHWQVSISGINNTTEKATQENQDRATLAQILGGIAIGISLYYTWRRIGIAEKDLQVTQENLKVAQDNLKASQKSAQDNLEVARQGQITERFTRAIDQLGNEKMEIRLGGIYALERISMESDKDYWPIMEILTAYIRKNSSYKVVGNKKDTYLSMDIQADESKIREISEEIMVSIDIQAILTVITKREFSYGNGKNKYLNLRMTHLERADLAKAHLERANLSEAHLEGANLYKAHLKGAILDGAHLKGANLIMSDFQGVSLQDAYLYDVKNLTINQLSKVKTLYNAKLDEELEEPLKEKYPILFEKPD